MAGKTSFEVFGELDFFRADYFDGVDIGQGFQSFLKGLQHTSNPTHFTLSFDK